MDGGVSNTAVRDEARGASGDADALASDAWTAGYRAAVVTRARTGHGPSDDGRTDAADRTDSGLDMRTSRRDVPFPTADAERAEVAEERGRTFKGVRVVDPV